MANVFKLGDQVRCINNVGEDRLVVGNTYTLKGVMPGKLCVDPSSHNVFGARIGRTWFNENRFAHLHPDKAPAAAPVFTGDDDAW